MQKLPQFLLAAPLALAISVTVAEDKSYDFNLPAQPLAAALDALARQTGLQPFYADGIMAGKRAPGHRSLDARARRADATGG